MNAETDDALGIFFSTDSTFPSDDATSDLGLSFTGAEFEGFSAITL